MAKLGDLERAVLDCLWQSGEPATVREVHEALLPQRQLAYTTVMTTLQRLAKKGLVRQDAGDRAHRFSAIATRDELFAELMSEALGIVGDDRHVLVRFIDRMGPQAREVLSDALHEADRQTEGDGRG
ncbi:BlaI/MecI/CopY family transcriptional regulator [Actinokineospora guangxiensis]|uniref:BlaI/MecI/CopY family transcriptional regulator n=1 Tax=Actinokineospora guangxiensis TaxID=1490288 RepID=A0ABW0ENL1_9PSEU